MPPIRLTSETISAASDVIFFAPAALADLEQRAGRVAGIQRQEQQLVGARPQHPLHQVGRTIVQQREESRAGLLGPPAC